MQWRHMGKWRYGSTILDLGTRWRWVVSFTPLPLYTRGKSPRYPLDWEQGGHTVGLKAVVERKFLPLPGREPPLSSSVGGWRRNLYNTEFPNIYPSIFLGWLVEENEMGRTCSTYDLKCIPDCDRNTSVFVEIERRIIITCIRIWGVHWFQHLHNLVQMLDLVNTVYTGSYCHVLVTRQEVRIDNWIYWTLLTSNYK
jgi:hypothetical protein